MAQMAKLFCEEQVNGETIFRNLTTTTLSAAATFAAKPERRGHPMWAWASIPPGQVIAVDFTDAPIATADPATNLALIQAITATPAEKLVYAE